MKIIKVVLLIFLVVPFTGCTVRNDAEPCIQLKNIFCLPGTATCTNDRLNFPSTTFGITSWLVLNVKALVTQITGITYAKISSNDGYATAGNPTDNAEYKKIIGALLALVVAFYAIAVFLGIVAVNPYSLVMVAIKIILVYTFATNWVFFKEYFIDPLEFFISGSIKTFNNFFSDKQLVVAGSAVVNVAAGDSLTMIDDYLSIFVSRNFIALILTLILTGTGGIVYAVILLFMIWKFMQALIGAIGVYLISMIARNMLYGLAPIFLLFALFKETKSFFDGWLEQILNFTLQPILLFAFLSMNMMIIGHFLEMVVSFDQVICKRIWMPLGGWWEALYWYRLGDGIKYPAIDGEFSNIPINFWAILSVLIMVFVMRGMTDWAVQIASSMSGGFTTAANNYINAWKAVRNQGIKAVATAAGGILSGISGGARGAYSGFKQRGVSGALRDGLKGVKNGAKAGAKRNSAAISEGLGKNRRFSTKQSDEVWFEGEKRK